MHSKKFLIGMSTIVSLLLLGLVVFYGFSNRGDGTLPDNNFERLDIGKTEVDFQVTEEVEESGQKVEDIFIPIADLEDIKKADSESFPFEHQVINGQEWIKSGIEDYMVLNYKTPMISNSDVKGVQEILKNMNLYLGVIDGIYGPVTQEAVAKFQDKYGLLPTGIMDLDDYHLLASVARGEVIQASGKVKPEGDVFLLVVLDERTLYVIENGKVYHKFPVAIGTRETPSPIGNWKIISKSSWGGGFGTRWLGLNVPYGKFGIHGTNKPWSVGRAESHGCFRMYNWDVETLYEWVTWGTRVYVVGGDFPFNLPWRVINDGDRGSDVWILQNRLKELGYYKYRPDGVFGWGTKNAVMRFQKDHGLKVDGEVSWTTLNKLGLYLFQ